MSRRKVIVVGAGLIGAAIAFRLAQKGVAVTVIEAASPAARASGQTFGWINACFYQNPHHHQLRAQSIEAYPRLLRDARSQAVNWQGCLWWEETGDAFDKMVQDLGDLEYPFRELGRAEFAEMSPQIAAPPERALYFPHEGAADGSALTHDILGAAGQLGTKIITGTPVVDFIAKGDRVSGVRTDIAEFEADLVIVAAGTATQGLLARLDITVPMLTRPGLLLRTQPLAPVLNHIMISPGLEFRQERSGRILAPTAASHQSDDSDTVTERPDVLADRAIATLQKMLPDLSLEWQEVALAMRPVPADGLPVIGHTEREGLYVATLHSGVTLGAIAADLVAQEIVEESTADMLSPYRLSRFSAE